jgi:hypothetical protein
LGLLVENRCVVELDAGLELTAKGEAEVHRDGAMPTHSARVYLVDGKFVVKQASLRGTPAEYVIDEERLRQVDLADKIGIAEAVGDAVNGRL